MKRAMLLMMAAFTAAGARAFDEFSVGARPAAFSGAFTALADDVHSLYYNPAGLASLGRPEVTAYYAKLFPDLSDQSNAAMTFMAYGQPLRKDRNWGGFGAGWSEFKVDDLFKERSLITGYGRDLPWMGLSLGGNVKVLQRVFGETPDTQNAIQGANPAGRLGMADPLFNGGRSAQAISLDLGMTAHPSPNLSLGASLSNLNGPDLGLASPDRVPLLTRLGAAYKFPFLRAHMDITRRSYIKQEPDHRILAGAERSWLLNRYGEVAVRAGAGVGSRGFRQTTFGLGYEVNGIGVDYVFIMPLGGLTDTGNNHQISLSFRFGKSPGDEELTSLMREEREATARAEEALRLAQAESVFVKQDRNQILAEMEKLRAQIDQLKAGGAVEPVTTPAATGALGAAARERAARDKAQREFNAAYQAGLAQYTRKSQRGANFKERIGLLDDILSKYADKEVDLSRAKTELEKVKADLAQAESDYRITLDFYRKTVADGAEPADRISLLERMTKKYGKAGLDLSEIQKELQELKKNR
jgi:hypothetical protein